MTLSRALEIVDINDLCNKQLEVGLCKDKDCEDCPYSLSPKDYNEVVHTMYGYLKTINKEM